MRSIKLFGKIDALRVENEHLRDYIKELEETNKELKETNKELSKGYNQLFNALINANRKLQKYDTD